MSDESEYLWRFLDECHPIIADNAKLGAAVRDHLATICGALIADAARTENEADKAELLRAFREIREAAR